MKRKAAVLGLILMLTLSFSLTVRAEILTFDDIPAGPLPADYGGFTWTFIPCDPAGSQMNVAAYNPEGWPTPPPSLPNSLLFFAYPGPTLNWDALSTLIITRDSPFLVTNALIDNQLSSGGIKATYYLGSISLGYSEFLYSDDFNWQWYNTGPWGLSFVDKVVITYPNPGSVWDIDNIEYQLQSGPGPDAPLPGTLLLLGFGL
ncbi:MAG: hypothetical protein WC405_20205, partial [Syntrophales bacterium]